MAEYLRPSWKHFKETIRTTGVEVQQHAAALVAKARRASTGGLPADEAALALPAFAAVTVARAANLTVPKEEGPAPVPAATEPDPADAATKCAYFGSCSSDWGWLGWR